MILTNIFIITDKNLIKCTITIEIISSNKKKIDNYVKKIKKCINI